MKNLFSYQGPTDFQIVEKLVNQVIDSQGIELENNSELLKTSCSLEKIMIE